MKPNPAECQLEFIFDGAETFTEATIVDLWRIFARYAHDPFDAERELQQPRVNHHDGAASPPPIWSDIRRR